MNYSLIQNQYCDYVDRQRVSIETRRRKKNIAKRYIIHLSDNKILLENSGYESFCNFMISLNHLKPNSYNLYVIELKYFFLYLEQYYQYPVISHLVRTKSVPISLPRNIPLDLIIKLCTPMQGEKKTIINLRNQAILEFLFSTGCRGCEVRQAKICDLSKDMSECQIKTAKNGKDRIVYLGDPAVSALQEYLEKRNISSMGKNAFIFTSISNQKLDSSTLNQIINKIAVQRIGCPITPHMIRHTFATEMLRSTKCIRSVQEMLGHVSINNTARYCHLDFCDALSAVNTYHPSARIL